MWLNKIINVFEHSQPPNDRVRRAAMLQALTKDNEIVD